MSMSKKPAPVKVDEVAEGRAYLAKLSPSVRKRIVGAEMASLGARKGGRARAQKLSQEDRSRIAHQGGRARWGLAPNDGAMPPKPVRRKSRSAA